jgi:hypothetical protein
MSIGSGPIAKGPIAANNGNIAPPSGNVLTGTTVTFTGFLPSSTYGIPAIRISQATMEAVLPNVATNNIHVSQMVTEAVHVGAPVVRTKSNRSRSRTYWCTCCSGISILCRSALCNNQPEPQLLSGKQPNCYRDNERYRYRYPWRSNIQCGRFLEWKRYYER